MKKLALSDEILLQVDKPARYIGNEVNMIVKDPKKVDIRFAMCFPDVYEIGMSHLGIQILYDMFNRREDTYCERVYSPWLDLDKIMREKDIPLFAIESQEPIKNFDFLGITLQYEMCYTNILQILDLSKIPLITTERGEDDPIVIGGGPCSYNPEPIANFFDMFYIGEGETQYDELLDIYKENKKNGGSRKEFLEKAAHLSCIYVPQFYDVTYNEDGTIKEMIKNNENARDKVRKDIVLDMNEVYYPTKPLVPFIKATQDRVVLEVMRGCSRGCRFCQAGQVYRPVREKSLEKLKDTARKMIESTGHEEISLSSLSTSDYSQLKGIVNFLIDEFKEKNINISLPSLRIDSFALDIMSKVQDVKKSSLTFAPEAGTQRLRDVINKNVTEDEVIRTCTKAFDNGWTSVKLYFMMGLPTETMEDIEGIANLGMQVIHAFYNNPNRQKGTGVQVSISCASFIPKPFTPFQWEPEDSMESLKQKQKHLLESIPTKKIRVSYHETPTSLLEGVLARGDRRLGKVIFRAYELGCKFDSWDDQFNFDAWMQAFNENGIEPHFYTHRKREFSELLPWDHLDYGVSRKFLENENKKAHENKTTPHCRIKCAGCGANKLNGGHCDARS